MGAGPLVVEGREMEVTTMTFEELMGADPRNLLELCYLDRMECVNCSACMDCSLCVYCGNCSCCFQCQYCYKCSRCRTCTRCANCENCANCSDCIGVRNAQNLRYMAFDCQCTEEQFNQFHAKYVSMV
jgi:hypothetical protein